MARSFARPSQLPPMGDFDQERRWGMSPGFDRPDQDDFFRPVTYTCMFCHNGLPGAAAGARTEER